MTRDAQGGAYSFLQIPHATLSRRSLMRCWKALLQLISNAVSTTIWELRSGEGSAFKSELASAKTCVPTPASLVTRCRITPFLPRLIPSRHGRRGEIRREGTICKTSLGAAFSPPPLDALVRAQ